MYVDGVLLCNIFYPQVTSAVLSSVSRPDLTNALATLLKYPVYFELSDGTVGRVFGPEKESVFCSNLKKGIISLFQMQNKDGNREEVIIEKAKSGIFTLNAL